MKLTLKQIKDITLGAEYVDFIDESIVFHRFTPEEEEIYRTSDAKRGKKHSPKCVAPAGVKLSFKTNSTKILLRAKMISPPSRKYFSFEVIEDNNSLGLLDNFSDVELKKNYVASEYRLGDFEKEFRLSEGEKHITVHLPWSFKPTRLEIELDDGATIIPVRPKKRLLCYGDSITQGYDALTPSKRYASQLANALDAEEINKAIGGEVFFPCLAKAKASFIPDVVTVAYGTNDWSTQSHDGFFETVLDFYTSLSEKYRTVPIFAITPIWRADNGESKAFGEFSEVEEIIKKATKELSNVTVIEGNDLLPHDTELYADLRLHPNDRGFEIYAQNLIDKIKRHIKF